MWISPFVIVLIALIRARSAPDEDVKEDVKEEEQEDETDDDSSKRSTSDNSLSRPSSASNSPTGESPSKLTGDVDVDGRSIFPATTTFFCDRQHLIHRKLCVPGYPT